MMIKKKENNKGRASRVVAMAAVVALGTGALAAPALAIEDNGLMVEENALLLHGKLAGFGEGGFYIDPTAFLKPFMAIYVLAHKALITPVALIGSINFNTEGYEDQ